VYCRGISHTHRRQDDARTAAATATATAVPASLCQLARIFVDALAYDYSRLIGSDFNATIKRRFAGRIKEINEKVRSPGAAGLVDLIGVDGGYDGVAGVATPTSAASYKVTWNSLRAQSSAHARTNQVDVLLSEIIEKSESDVCSALKFTSLISHLREKTEIRNIALQTIFSLNIISNFL